MIYTRKWDSIRTKGKILFALSHGIVAGLIVFLIALAWIYADEGFLEPMDVLLWFIGCLTGGIILYNTLFWRINEKLYKDRKAKEGGSRNNRKKSRKK